MLYPQILFIPVLLSTIIIPKSPSITHHHYFQAIECQQADSVTGIFSQNWKNIPNTGFLRAAFLSDTADIQTYVLHKKCVKIQTYFLKCNTRNRIPPGLHEPA